MEVRNSTPSFGMALVKPASKDMAEFTKVVVRGRKPKMMARGLKQMQKAHETDKYVDIVYLPGKKGFAVVPKQGMETVVEEKVAGKATEFVSTNYPSRFDKVSEEITAQLEALESSNVGKFKKTMKACGVVLKGLKEAARVCLRPKEILPADLRAASDMATRIEKSINRDVANTNLMNKTLK